MTERDRPGNQGGGGEKDAAGELRALMVRYQRGEVAAFRELFRRVSARLHRYLAMSTSVHDPDDLLQQTWLQVHRARATYDPSRAVLPWLFAIARNVRRHASRGAHRGERRDRDAAAAVRVAHAAKPPAAAALVDALAVRAALERLPERQREVLLLMKYADLSVEEVAAVVGTTPGAVKQRAHRAYSRLRAELGEEELDLGPLAQPVRPKGT